MAVSKSTRKVTPKSKPKPVRRVAAPVRRNGHSGPPRRLNSGLVVTGVPDPVAADVIGGIAFQRVKVAGGAEGVATDFAVDPVHGLRVDVARIRKSVTTTVAAIAVVAGAMPLAAANTTRRKIVIHYDAPQTEIVLILEGGAGPITDNNWSFPLRGGQTYVTEAPSDGAYAALAANQQSLVGTIRVTDG